MDLATHSRGSSASHGRVLRALGLLVLGATLLTGLRPSPVAAQTTFTVTDTGDAPDANAGNGLCATGGGTCTLRAALQEANALTGNQEIHFDIAGTAPHTIQPASALPAVSDPASIDGASEPDYTDRPVVVIDGQNTTGADGLTLTRSSLVNALAIINFDGEGLLLRGTSGSTLQNNYIGVAADGSAAGNGGNGLEVTENATSTLIGPNNVISANALRGIFIGLSGEDDNSVYGNYIGTGPDGMSPMGNGYEGVLINGAANTIVGGTGSVNAGSRNVISGNGRDGVTITGSGATDNLVNGNYIGVAADGATDLGNTKNGIEISDEASLNLIGSGNADGTGNVISGNGENGLLIAGTIATSGPSDNLVAANHIGTDAAGTAAVPNDADGVNVEFADGNAIGSTLAAANVISGNGDDGVDVTGENTDIAGNIIGVTADESSTLGNEKQGIFLRSGSHGSALGGAAPAFANIVGGNAQGLRISSSDNVSLEGSFIGIGRDDANLGNAGTGVLVDVGSENVTLGGTADGAENVISGNEGVGLVLSDFNDDGTSGAQVLGNLIGTDTDGDAAVPNGAGGIAIEEGASDNTVGGTASGAPNTIAHNDGAGVAITSGAAPAGGNSVRANAIFKNSGPGLDLGSNGQTANDTGDPDEGPNRLQNHPDIQSASYDAGADAVTVTYQVPSNPNATGSGASAYDLTVDFYRAGAAQEEGAAYLGTDTYTVGDYNTSTSGPDAKTVTFTPEASVSSSDYVVATATDANGNTSEFSVQSSQLPVALTDLEATPSGSGTVALRWQVASERSNAGFAVQHRGPASSGWTRLGFVESAVPGGTTSDPQSYRYEAADLTVGTHQFRLRQVDVDGTSSLTDPVSVDLQMKAALRLSGPAPNPVRGRAVLSVAVREGTEATVSLYNVLGRHVRTLYRGRPSPGDALRVHLSTHDLASGLYIVRLQALGQTRTRRVTVVR